jgi:kynurenine formamidase
MEGLMTVIDASARGGYPVYAELLARTDGPPGSSWGVFGEGDELGTVNFMTSDTVIQALASARHGQVFNLDFPINAFPDSPYRSAAKHTILSSDEYDSRDDFLDGFYLQGTSQIDGLRHCRHHDHGFYGGAADSAIHEDSPTLGIGRWSAGIIGRGVLLDIGRFLARQGTPLDYESAQPIEIDILDAVAREADLTFRAGDILLIRTGWAAYLLSEEGRAYRESGRWAHTCPGLAQSRDALEWLWDHRFAVVAADNIGLEVTPPVASTPFTSGTANGFMHQDLIAMLGVVIGELWALEELAAECAQDGTYDCAVIVKPLNLAAGVGSPANALAIR